VVNGPVWYRADTVVWVDPPRNVVMRQLVRCTFIRFVTREELWNGNRERIGALFSWDPITSIIRWSWTQHQTYRARYGAAMSSPDYAHLHFIRLRSRPEVARWLATLHCDPSA
jgi:hypothetical protein